MGIELLVIGDEILSGKRVDRHVPAVISMLRRRGMELEGVQFVGDDSVRISAAIHRIRDAGNAMLSCGGIGATPDDCTRHAAALAFAVPVVRHPEALALIEARYGDRAYPNRVRMADFPEGASLIPNPVNNVAGFYLADCYFVPGFPEMAWPMLEWVLDKRLLHLHRATPPVEYTLRIWREGLGESDLLELMEEVLTRYQGLRISSLPFRGDGTTVAHVEIGFRGAEDMAASAYHWFVDQMPRLGIHIKELHAPVPRAR